VERRPKHPLLVTRCDDCMRPRACYPMPAGLWLCKLCIRRCARGGIKAMDAFHEQGR